MSEQAGFSLADFDPDAIELSTGWIGLEIVRARRRAHEKHGENSVEAIDGHDPRWLAILVEEVGELAHEQTYDAEGRLREELLDVATVAVAWIAALDRGGKS